LINRATTLVLTNEKKILGGRENQKRGEKKHRSTTRSEGFGIHIDLDKPAEKNGK